MNKPASTSETTLPPAQVLLMQHAELDRRVRELDRRAFLTPSEQRERAELKKQKLALKDALARNKA